MTNAIETRTLRIKGRTYTLEVYRDQDHDAPWDESDAHGPVSPWTTRDKLPGELVLVSSRYTRRYYDFQAACAQARAGGWRTGSDPWGKSARQLASEAARADFARLRAWCRDDWYYVGLVLTPCPVDGQPEPQGASLWGVESDDDLERLCEDLAEECTP